MTSRALLPLFGGSFQVWGLSLAFFQAVVLAGYVLADRSVRWMNAVRQSRLHLPLLILPWFFTSLSFDWTGLSTEGHSVAVSVLTTLLRGVGFPAIILAMTSPVLQSWLGASYLPEKTNPYVLYSASNLGSLLALLTYPLLAEPLFSLKQQWMLWLTGYGVLCALHVFCASAVRDTKETGDKTGSAPQPGAGDVIAWFLSSVAGSAMLLAVTNVITLDLASVPFLWAMPLSVYLLGFVVAFKRNPWNPGWRGTALRISLILGALLYLMNQLRQSVPIHWALLLHHIVLFVVCWNCDMELIARKPAGSHLTGFYVVIAVGGLAGSIVVSWIIPLTCNGFVEYPLGLALCALAAAWCCPIRNLFTKSEHGRKEWMGLVMCALLAVFSVTVLPGQSARLFKGMTGEGQLVLTLTLLSSSLALLAAGPNLWRFGLVFFVLAVTSARTEDVVAGTRNVKRHRNFYGIYKIYDFGNMRFLKHGAVQHGRQYLSGPNRNTPLSYFHPTTPAAEVLRSPRFHFRHIGMVGLGTGALAAYAASGQTFMIMELDPDNIPIAETEFSYLDQARRQGAEIRFVTGDGRISLRGEPAGSLDLLIIDAFTSGSIPVHLLTVDALDEYLRALDGRGLLLLHVSNRILNLEPVIRANARALSVAVCEKHNADNLHYDADPTHWMAVSKDKGVMDILTRGMGWHGEKAGGEKICRPWTDRYSNLMGAIIFR